MDFQYNFTHKKSGKKVIAQSWEEFYKLQSDEEYEITYLLLGQSRIPKEKVNSYETRKKINSFWEGAKGFEKIGKIKCSGIPTSGIFNSIRNFLTNIRNHACMTGDIETFNKTIKSDKYFHHNGRITQLLLNQ